MHLDCSLVYHLVGIASTIPKSYTPACLSHSMSVKTVPYENSALNLIIYLIFFGRCVPIDFPSSFCIAVVSWHCFHNFPICIVALQFPLYHV
jgi:hypothetical protein